MNLIMGATHAFLFHWYKKLKSSLDFLLNNVTFEHGRCKEVLVDGIHQHWPKMQLLSMFYLYLIIKYIFM